MKKYLSLILQIIKCFIYWLLFNIFFIIPTLMSTWTILIYIFYPIFIFLIFLQLVMIWAILNSKDLK